MKWKKILPLIGILIFVYLLWKIGLGSIFSNFKDINYFYFVIAIVLIPVGLIFQTEKWTLILQRQKIKLSFKKSFKIYLLGMFYGLITPARTGSLLRANYLQEEIKKPWIVCASGIILERILDLIAICVFAFIGVIFILRGASVVFLPILIAVSLIFILGCVVIFSKKMSKFFLEKTFFFLMSKRIKEKSKNLFESFYDSLPNMKKLVPPFIFTVLTWIVLYLQSYFVARAFGIDIQWWIFIFLMPITVLVVLLPISISGLGTRDATWVFLITKVTGVAPADKALVFSIVAFLLNLIIPALFVLFTMKEYLKK